MPKSFIRCGIDHGTTNSAIACLDSGRVTMISPSSEDTMPSVVFYRTNGAQFIGKEARESIVYDETGTAHEGYKLTLGQDERFNFPGARKNHSGIELTGIVIGELLRYFYKQMGFRPEAAVVTVPAMFTPGAIAATKEGAALAGLRHVEILLEPIAAALAYGFHEAVDGERWIIFDIGGGTLDVSFVTMTRSGPHFDKESHMGDNTLGGRKFDLELESHVLDRLEAEGKREGFAITRLRKACMRGSGGGEADSLAMRLRYFVEMAKIDLSKQESVVLGRDRGRCVLKGGKDDGGDLTVELPLDRATYERLIAPDIERAVNLCEMLINKHGLTRSEIARIALVGGPSKTPILRRALRDRFGLPMDERLDPMTVVAQGAAIYAATREDPTVDLNLQESADGRFALQLEYERTSVTTQAHVAGLVLGEGIEAGTHFVQISRSDGQWQSPRIPLGPDGAFSCDLLLCDGDGPTQSLFATSLMHANGVEVLRSNEPEIWLNIILDVDQPARTTCSWRVGLADGGSYVLIKEGAGLPKKGRGTFKAAHRVVRGSDDQLLIPLLAGVADFLGGEVDRSDCHAHIGTLILSGKELESDIEESADIDITIEVDASADVTVKARVVLTGAKSSAKFKHEPYKADPAASRERFDRLRSDIGRIRALHDRDPIELVDRFLKKLDSENVFEALESELHRWEQGNPESKMRAYQRVLELAGAVHRISEAQRPARIRQHIERLSGMCRDPRHIAALETLRKEFEGAISSDETPTLVPVERAADDLDIELRRSALFEVMIDVLALNGRQMYPHQGAIFRKGDALWDEILAKGGSEALTSDDVSRLRAMHQSFEQAFPDLYAARQEYFEKNPHQQDDLQSGLKPT